MLSCKEVYELASDYLDADLPAADVASYTSHLDACPRCRDFYDSFALTVRCARQAVSAPVPAGLEDLLITRIREIRARSA